MTEKLIANKFEKNKILELVPQQEPFRFIDSILELSNEHIVGQYTYKEDQFFISETGSNTVPGSILSETMAQIGVVALGLYIVYKEKGLSNLSNVVTAFVQNDSEYFMPVVTGETITIKGNLIDFDFEKNRIVSEITMYNQQGKKVATSELMGQGVDSQFFEASKDIVIDGATRKNGWSFVDYMEKINSENLNGSYTYKLNEKFNIGHFPNNPVIPGVILTETMAQIGLDPFIPENNSYFISEAASMYKKPVFPGETITIKSELSYFEDDEIEVDVVALNEFEEVASTIITANLKKLS